MFVGHYGPSFVAKKAEPSVPLWVLLVAVQFLDILWAPLVLLGIEKVRIVQHFTASNALDLYYMPYTHGLLTALFWSLFAGVLYHFVVLPSRRQAGVLVGLAVFSHWTLDFIVHVPHLPLYDNSAKVGLGLWNTPALAYGLETAVLLAGMWLCLRGRQERTPQTWIFGVLLLAIQAEVIRLFEASNKTLGSLVGLVNNAGVLETQMRVAAMDASRLHRVFATNVVGAFMCEREAVRRLSTKRGGNGGAIVNVSSGAARLGSPGEYVDYAASKGAIDTFSIGLVREVAEEGIRVNAVRAGFIYTEMHASGGEPDRVDRVRAFVPMKRGGTVDEVAYAILWLLSSEASYTTGAFVDVTGENRAAQQYLQPAAAGVIMSRRG